MTTPAHNYDKPTKGHIKMDANQALKQKFENCEKIYAGMINEDIHSAIDLLFNGI